ncbi:MAG: hypothetical protein LUG83_09725 [Lachnospiraceae bacterium]|nr:hypothetical protein [Lachnospiraceae bacterium]
MNLDFHYYGTYSAARLAGYEREDAKVIAYYAQFVDECSNDFLTQIGRSDETATVQSSAELTKLSLDTHKYTENELKEAAEIWGGFHFLPGNVDGKYQFNAKDGSNNIVPERVCLPDSTLLLQTVVNAKAKGTLPATGMAMHILADTWAHCYFAGIPCKSINDASGDVFEVKGDNADNEKLRFTWDILPDNLEKNHYSCTPPNPLRDNSIVYLGHARMGHLPDYGFMKYSYVPEWNGRVRLIKDNPTDYMKAFCQMIYAMQYIRGDVDNFETGVYAKLGNVTEEQIKGIINTRKADTSEEWENYIANEAFRDDEEAGGIEKFDLENCKTGNYLNEFFDAAREHKRFVVDVVGEYK